MTMRTLLLTIPIVAGILICSAEAFACPCSPCRCSPCNCGGMSSSSKPKPAKTAPPRKAQTSKTEHGTSPASKTGKSQSYHKGKDRQGGHSSHTEFGVGVDIDLSGIGQRRPEPDPFAVGGGPPPVAGRTEQKPPPTTKPREAAKDDPFANVRLTGPEAKGESNP